MRRASPAFAVVLATAACASGTARAAPTPAQDSWAFELAASPTSIRGGDDYTSATLSADHGPLHLEARYDYEAVGARSAFVGWTFSGGEETTWELTPLLGGAWGEFQAIVPGLEASVAHGRFDLYVEAEYVHDTHDSAASYFYAWSELGFQPVERLRLGVVGERTRAYGGERDVQRGPFAQLTFEHLTLGGYWFNIGASDQVFVGLIGATF